MILTAHTPADIRRASSALRTDRFRTRLRDNTRGIYVAYTNTPADPRIDAAALDHFDASRFYLGVTWHYVIRTSGLVEIARHPLTIAAQPRKRCTQQDHIAIGIVGGRNSTDYEIEDTINTEQAEALEALMQSLADALQVPLEVTDRCTDRTKNSEERRCEWEERKRAQLAEEEQEFLEELEDAQSAAT